MSTAPQVLESLVVKFLGDATHLLATTKHITAEVTAAQQQISSQLNATNSASAVTTKTAVNDVKHTTKIALDSAEELTTGTTAAATAAATATTNATKAATANAAALSAQLQQVQMQLQSATFWSQAFSTATWAIVGSYVAYRFTEWALGYTDALEEAAAMQEKVAEFHRERNSQVLSDSEELFGSTKTNFLEEQIEQTKRNLRGQSEAVQHARKILKGMENDWRSIWGNKVLAHQRTEIEELSASANTAQQHLHEMMKELAGRKEFEALQLASDIEELNAELQKQVDLHGKAAFEADLYDLQVRGATQEQLAESRRLNAELERLNDLTKLDEARTAAKELAKSWEQQAQNIGMSARELEIFKAAADGIDTAKLESANAALTEKELQQSVDQYTSNLQEQLDTFYMTTEQAGLYKLALDGATDAQLANARAIAAQIEARREEKKALEELEREHTKLTREQERAHQRDVKAAEQIIKSLLSPQQDILLQEQELLRLRKQGLLTAEQYAAQLEKIHSQSGQVEINFVTNGLQQVQEQFLMMQGVSEPNVTPVKPIPTELNHRFTVSAKPPTAPKPLENPLRITRDVRSDPRSNSDADNSSKLLAEIAGNTKDLRDDNRYERQPTIVIEEVEIN